MENCTDTYFHYLQFAMSSNSDLGAGGMQQVLFVDLCVYQ